MKKNNNKKPKKVKKRKSRYTKPSVIKAVNEKHFFECAWCCTTIMERHHIVEFANGGGNTEDNLILLCSNCHTEVHKKDSEIKFEDLILRKSTHLKGDRITGNFPFEIKKNKIKLGKTFFENWGTILSFGSEPVIKFVYDDTRDEYFLNCRLYNKKGELIFWLSKNRYWALSSFNIQTNASDTSLEISNSLNDNYYLKFWQECDYMNFIGKSYRNGKVFEVDSNQLNIGNKHNGESQITLTGGGSINGNGYNILINM